MTYTGEEHPLKSLKTTVAFAADDWGQTRGKAWLYGIICGWDDAMAEVAARFHWEPETVARLQRLHESFDRAIEATS